MWHLFRVYKKIKQNKVTILFEHIKTHNYLHLHLYKKINNLRNKEISESFKKKMFTKFTQFVFSNMFSLCRDFNPSGSEFERNILISGAYGGCSIHERTEQLCKLLRVTFS